MSMGSDFKKQILRSLAIFLVTSFTAPIFSPSAFAHERTLPFTEEYRTIPKGEFELEGWTTFKLPSHNTTNKNSFEYQGELEYGITDHWTVAHYQRWKTSNVKGSDDTTDYTGFKFETKYRIGEKGQYWLDPLLYLEWITNPQEEENPNVIEGKIVLAKEIERFNFAYNQVMESELGKGGRTTHGYRVGMNYEFLDSVYGGVEFKGDYWRPSSNRNRFSLGPSLAYSNQYFWVTTGVLFGANHAADDIETRVIVGVPIG